MSEGEELSVPVVGSFLNGGGLWLCWLLSQDVQADEQVASQYPIKAVEESQLFA